MVVAGKSWQEQEKGRGKVKAFERKVSTMHSDEGIASKHICTGFVGNQNNCCLNDTELSKEIENSNQSIPENTSPALNKNSQWVKDYIEQFGIEPSFF